MVSESAVSTYPDSFFCFRDVRFCTATFPVEISTYSGQMEDLLERPVVSDHCAVVVDETHCVSKWCIRAICCVHTNCIFSTPLKPIQGDVSPDGGKVIAIKLPNCCCTILKEHQ